MSKISSILFLRLKQFWRAIAHAGVGVVLLAVLVTFGLTMQALTALREMDWQTVGLLSLAVTWSLHASRKDLFFLRSICPNGWAFKSVLASEYLLLLSPLLLLYGWGGQWQQIIAIASASVITSLSSDLLPAPNKPQTKKRLYFIPQKYFEIKSRVEKKPILFAIIYGMSFLSVFHIAFFPVSIVMLSTFLVDVFKYLEPSEMVHFQKNFVFKKIKWNAGFLLLAYLPPFLLCLFFQWEFKWVAVYAIAILMTVTILSINFKYVHYSPLHPEMESSNTLSFLLLLSFLPGFILITIGYSFIQYFKAEKNMQYYFGNRN